MRCGEKQEVQEIKGISSRAKSFLEVETIVSSVFLNAIKSTSNEGTFLKFYIELKYVQKNLTRAIKVWCKKWKLYQMKGPFRNGQTESDYYDGTGK